MSLKLQEALVVQHLNSYPGLAFCDDCLASELGMTTREVRRIKAGLERSPAFNQHTWFCSRCMRVAAVIHADWQRPVCLCCPARRSDAAG